MTINKKNTAITFPGQGSQFVGMGKDIYDNFSYIRHNFELVNDILKTNLTKIILEGPSQELTQTQNTQPALMLISIALLEVMKKEFGFEIQNNCAFVAGHSLGEYSAICAAGAIDITTTAKLLKIRGQSMADCATKQKGEMAAILGKDISEVEAIANNVSNCQIANDNSKGQIVISGSSTGINDFITKANAAGIKKIIKLPVSGAFHSYLMENAAQEMQIALEKTTLHNLEIPLINNIEAKSVTNAQEIKKLLVKQITGRVRWRESLLFLEKNGVENFIEIGAGKVLSGLATRTCSNIKAISIQNLEDIRTFFA